MIRNPNTLFLHQTFIGFFWVLTLVSSAFITIWVLLYLQESSAGRRPAFNLKEI